MHEQWSLMEINGINNLPSILMEISLGLMEDYWSPLISIMLHCPLINRILMVVHNSQILDWYRIPIAFISYQWCMILVMYWFQFWFQAYSGTVIPWYNGSPLEVFNSSKKVLILGVSDSESSQQWNNSRIDSDGISIAHHREIPTLFC